MKSPASILNAAIFRPSAFLAGGGRTLIAEGKKAGPKRRTFAFVNNRLEGNAISTIAALLVPG